MFALEYISLNMPPTPRLLANFPSSTGGRIELELRSVRAGIQGHIATTETRLESLQQKLVAMDQRMEDMATETQTELGLSQNSLADFEAEMRQALTQHRADGIHLVNSLVSQINQQNISLSRLTAQVESVSTFLNRIESDELAATNIFTSNSRYRQPLPALTITARHRRSACLDSCRCQCHMRKHGPRDWKLPAMFREVLGSLFVCYSGYPITSATCDSLSCDQARNSSICLDAYYIFPTWFLNYTFHMVFYKAAMQLPTVILVFRQRVPFETEGILFVAQRNYVAQIRALLETNPDAINHIDEEDGRSPLAMALGQGSPEAAQLLLNAGAGLDTPNDLGISPGMELAVGTLQKRYPDETRDALCKLVPISRYIEELELSPLMEAATGRRFERVASILGKHPEIKVDTVDITGKTALHWAAQVGNVAVAEELLLCGADVDAVDRRNTTPLMYSVNVPAGADLALFHLLIRYGADIRNPIYNTHPFHIACQGDHVEAVEVMLALGVPVGIKDTHAWFYATGVHWAVLGDRAEYIEVLLRNRASTNPRVVQGENAVMGAVVFNSHACLRVLLGAGADPSECHSVEGRYITHYAAMVGDVETMEILSNYPLNGIALDARDAVDGSTAQETFSKRRGVTPELRLAFENMVAAMQRTNEGRANPNLEEGNEQQGDSGDEEFYDAITDFDG